MLLTAVPVEDFDAVVGKLGVDERAKLGIDGREYLGQLFHLGHRQPAGGEGFRHLEADVAGADDQRARRRAVSSSVRMTANVSPIEWSRWTPSAIPSASAPASPSIAVSQMIAPVPITSLS